VLDNPARTSGQRRQHPERDKTRRHLGQNRRGTHFGALRRRTWTLPEMRGIAIDHDRTSEGGQKGMGGVRCRWRGALELTDTPSKQPKRGEKGDNRSPHHPPVRSREHEGQI
jgi:hypothetical protein